ncbi:hypothetical protein [Flavobacterium beibuense]|uniref:hypothetical protein n=1 Tax=Flavobacterium beibuense TaxID=657326 RepID=UPI003A9410C4
MKFLTVIKESGIDMFFLIAGMAGGFAFLNKTKNLNWKQKFTSVLSGGFTANYLTPIVGHWLDLDNNMLYGAAFLLGYGGLKSVEAVFILFQNKLGNDSNK